MSIAVIILSIYVNVKCADASAVGKFTTARVWHKAEQIIWVSLASVILGWVTTFVCTSVYLCTHTHTHTHISICVYEFMNQKCFSRHIWIHTCASLWIKSGFPYLPFQDGPKLVVCTDSVTCSVTNGVCTSAASSFIRNYFSQHISIKSTQTWYMYSWHKQAIVKRRIWLPSIAICIK